MRYPTEEEILAIESELTASSEFHHENTELYGDCETCKFDKELDMRCERLKGPTAIDSMMMSLLASEESLGKAILAAGPPSLGSLRYCIRVAFYIGFKAGLMQDNLEEMLKE